MFDKILVPTDFSDDAGRALNYAVDLAKRFGGQIELLHAFHLEVPTGIPGEPLLPPGLYDQLRDAAKSRLQALVERVSAEGIEVNAEAVAGPASQAILGRARDLPADLIVMGTRGLTGLKYVILGSTAERTVRLAPCPVLTVRS